MLYSGPRVVIVFKVAYVVGIGRVVLRSAEFKVISVEALQDGRRNIKIGFVWRDVEILTAFWRVAVLLEPVVIHPHSFPSTGDGPIYLVKYGRLSFRQKMLPALRYALYPSRRDLPALAVNVFSAEIILNQSKKFILRIWFIFCKNGKGLSHIYLFTSVQRCIYILGRTDYWVCGCKINRDVSEIYLVVLLQILVYIGGERFNGGIIEFAIFFYLSPLL